MTQRFAAEGLGPRHRFAAGAFVFDDRGRVPYGREHWRRVGRTLPVPFRLIPSIGLFALPKLAACGLLGG